MSTAADEPERRRRWRERYEAWASHHLVVIYWSYFAYCVALAFMPRDAVPGWLSVALSLLSGLGSFTLAMGLTGHLAPLDCQRCIDRFPLDAQARAESRMTRLTFAHRRRLLAWVSLPMVAWQMIGPFAIGEPGLGWPVWAWSLLVTPPLLLWLGWVGHCARIHQKYQLWCPICRRGRWDDDSDPVPQPKPVPVGEGT